MLFAVVIMLLADVSFSGFILINYSCVDTPGCASSTNTQVCTCDYSGAIAVLAVYPFAFLASPIIGLMALLFWLPFWIKRFLEWNVASMLSACVSVAVYAVLYKSLDQMLLCVVTSQVIIKGLLATLGQVHLSSMLRQVDDRQRRRLRDTSTGEVFAEGGQVTLL